LPAQLARDGDPEEVYFEEMDTRFAIAWRGDYRIVSGEVKYLRRQNSKPLANVNRTRGFVFFVNSASNHVFQNLCLFGWATHTFLVSGNLFCFRRTNQAECFFFALRAARAAGRSFLLHGLRVAMAPGSPCFPNIQCFRNAGRRFASLAPGLARSIFRMLAASSVWRAAGPG
jgi:hypothetical protein